MLLYQPLKFCPTTAALKVQLSGDNLSGNVSVHEPLQIEIEISWKGHAD